MSSSKTEKYNCMDILSDRKLVPSDQLKLFCQILQSNPNGKVVFHQDGGFHVHREPRRMGELEFPLARPNPITRKLFLPKQSEYTFLCSDHSYLNTDFVHQWFKCIQLEVGARLEILRASNRETVGAYAWDNIIKPLTRLHRMWMKDADVKRTFGEFCHQGFENSIDLISIYHQDDGCEACILKRIGSHANTLHALRCIVKSRISLESHAKHPKRLRLLRIIEPWIESLEKRFGEDESPEQRKRQRRYVTGLSEELYEKRKEIELDRVRQRRAQRHLLEVNHSNSKKYKQYVADLEQSANDGSAHDAENDIIDSYGALRAAQRASVIASVDILAGKFPGYSDYPAYQIHSATPSSSTQDTPSTPSSTTTESLEHRPSTATTTSSSRRSLLRGSTISENRRTLSGQWERTGNAGQLAIVPEEPGVSGGEGESMGKRESKRESARLERSISQALLMGRVKKNAPRDRFSSGWMWGRRQDGETN